MKRHPYTQRLPIFLGVILGLVVAVVAIAGCGTDAQSPTTASTNVVETATPQANNTPNSSGTPSPADPTQAPSATSTPAGSTPTSSPTSVPGVPTPTSSAPPTSTPPLTGRVEHPAGVSFSYPEEWEETANAVISTQFASGAECVSVRIIDREAPAGSGQAPFLYQSVVQVCSRPAEGQSLEMYMEDTYGAGMGGFEPLQIGTVTGFRLTEDQTTTVYVQNGTDRFQVVTSVVAEDPATENLRESQIQSILSSVRVE